MEYFNAAYTRGRKTRSDFGKTERDGPLHHSGHQKSKHRVLRTGVRQVLSKAAQVAHPGVCYARAP